MLEHWEKWIPSPDITSMYEIESINYDEHGFKITLFDIENKKNKIDLIYENWVFAFRKNDGIYKENIIDTIKKQNPTKFCDNWTFFKVTNSKYLQWIFEQSLETCDLSYFSHFSFITPTSILDIPDTHEPKIVFSNQP